MADNTKGSSAEHGEVLEAPNAEYALREFERSELWWTEEEEKRIRWKLDCHIVPFLFLTYLFAFLDRSNIGNAKTAGMNSSLNIGDEKYQWLLTIFYISYILFQCLLIGYKLVPPSKFMGTCVTLWGIAAILQGAAYNWSGMMAARFFIGLSEAGYGTGVALYLSFFYPRQEIGARFAGFVVGSAIASAIAGSVAYGLQSAKTSVESWRLIFIVEAAPTVILGLVLFVALPDRLSTCNFLNERERRVAEARLYRALIDRDEAKDHTLKHQGSEGKFGSIMNYLRYSLNFRNGAAAFKDPLSYMNAALLFIINVGFSSIPVYLPTILEGMGYESIRAQAFSAPPYVGAFVVALLSSYLADKTQIRGILVAIMTSIGIVGYFMLATLSNDHTRYGAVWLVVIGLFSFIPLCYMWLISNSSGETKRGVALIIFGTIGQCGPVLGTRLFPSEEGPYYRKGMFINGGLLLGSLLITLVGLVYLTMQNREKDRLMDKMHSESISGISNSSEKQVNGDLSQYAATEALQYKRKLDTKNADERNELHRRRIQIAIHGEKSVYFRYCL